MSVASQVMAALRSRGQLIILCVVLIVCGVTAPRWWPRVSAWVEGTVHANRAAAASGHDHGHGDAHGDTHTAAVESLELTPQARLNLGLTDQYLRPVTLSTYRRSISVPALVVPRPGRTAIRVSTPLTGVVTHVHAVTGETVRPGTLLFEIRLTHEDLVNSQTDFLRTLGELEVENRELERLSSVAQDGIIPQRTVLERRYAKDKLEAVLNAQRQALRLHGLSDRQIQEIEQEKHLLRDLQITAPEVDRHDHPEELRLSTAPLEQVVLAPEPGEESSHEHLLVVEQLDVHKGQSVTAGGNLCQLADLSRLYIEGHAFEQDADVVSRAAQRGWPLTAVFPGEAGDEMVSGLKLAYVGSSVDPATRTLSFFVDLPNVELQDQTNDEGQRYVLWQYRPGQRLQLEVPVEEWADQIVLPVDAVIREGADWFVFQQNGRKFDRVPVHVRHRDQRFVVVANDGSIFEGDVIAMRSAHQMQMAIRNQSGGAVDPHAGHNH